MEPLTFDLLADPDHPWHRDNMARVLAEADLAAAADEVPVGAVIVSLDRGILAGTTTSASSSATPRRTRRCWPSGRRPRSSAPGVWRIVSCT